MICFSSFQLALSVTRECKCCSLAVSNTYAYVSHKWCCSVIISAPSIPSTVFTFSVHTIGRFEAPLLLLLSSNCPALRFHFGALQISNFGVYFVKCQFLYKYTEQRRGRHQLVLWSLRINLKNNEGKSSLNSTLAQTI